MTIATFDELNAELSAWLNRADADYTARVPTLIRLFEARMNRLLRSPQQEVSLSQATIAGTAAYALPTDARKIRGAYLNESPVVNLAAMSASELRFAYPDTTTGTPAAFAISGQSIILAPTPNDAFSLVLNYFREVPALTSSASTNWLLTAHPDAYLFGSLAAAEAFLMNDDRVAFWKGGLDEVLSEIMAEANDQRMPSGPLASKPPIAE